MKRKNVMPISGADRGSWISAAGRKNVFLWEIDRNARAFAHGLRIPGLERFIALERYRPWWLRPAWGSHERDLPAAECQFLLWKRRDGRWGLLMPTANGNRRAWVQRGETGLSLLTRGSPHPDEPERLCLAAAGLGDDPMSLITSVTRVLMERNKTCCPLSEKAVPPWVDWFGWCTYNAFYNQVSADKIRAGLKSFAKDRLPTPLLLIDDGWQDVSPEGRLYSFRADPSKFPGGLAPIVKMAQEEFHVRMVGVWHSLVGYWSGPHPDGELAGRYRLLQSAGVPYNDPQSKPLRRSLVHPNDIFRFYHELYEELARQGVSMVKVDGQSSLDHFTNHRVPDYLTGMAYQQALQGAAAVHMGNNLVACMAMSSDAVWHMKSTPVLRNSDDYFPNKPASHGFHLCANAANALWTSQFALPDWDMFFSGHETGWYHGAARAISGGPVYVSDVPGKQDAKLIRALTLSGGRVARPQPARVADSRILVDCQREARLLLIRSQAVAGRFLGVFHCRHGEGSDPIVDTWSPADAGAIGRVAVRGFRGRKTEIMDAAEIRSITLDRLGWEIFTIAPFLEELAPLGLDGKLTGLAAITRWESPRKGLVLAEMADGGTLRVASDRRIRARITGGGVLPTRRDADDWLIRIPRGAPVRVTIEC